MGVLRATRYSGDYLSSYVYGFGFDFLVYACDGCSANGFANRGVGGLEFGGGAGNESAEGEVIEHFTGVSPDICASVLPKTFIVKAVYSCDLPRLVVPSDVRNSI